MAGLFFSKPPMALELTVDDTRFTATTFLALVQRVWPRV